MCAVARMHARTYTQRTHMNVITKALKQVIFKAGDHITPLY